MVSDTLFEAIHQIDDYLRTPSIYEGETRQMILELRNRMNDVRIFLDTPPGTKRESIAQNETGK